MVTLALARLRSGDWIGRERLVAYGAILLALELAAFLFLIAGTHGLIVPLDHPTTTDFASFYAAGALADAGTPQLAYNQAVHYLAEQQATAAGIRYVFFYYPPVWLLLCAVLPLLPYMAAFIAFQAVTVVPCLLVLRRILDEPRWSALVPALAFPPVFWNFGIGQNAFLTAALFGAATLLIDRRPAVAGLFFGALCYKPHFALLVPLALVASGHWRAFAAAALSAAALTLLSLWAFGGATWDAFLAAAAAAPAAYQGSGGFDLYAFASPFAAALLLGSGPVVAYAVQGVATLTAAALVGLAWRRRLTLPLRAATLAAATLVAIPVVLIYDLVLAGVAIAWVLRAARASGFLPWEKLMLGVIFVAPLFSRSLGAALHLPLTPLVAVALVALVARRVRHELALGRSAGAPARPWRGGAQSYGAG